MPVGELQPFRLLELPWVGHTSDAERLTEVASWFRLGNSSVRNRLDGLGPRVAEPPHSDLGMCLLGLDALLTGRPYRVPRCISAAR